MRRFSGQHFQKIDFDAVLGGGLGGPSGGGEDGGAGWDGAKEEVTEEEHPGHHFFHNSGFSSKGNIYHLKRLDKSARVLAAKLSIEA